MEHVAIDEINGDVVVFIARNALYADATKPLVLIRHSDDGTRLKEVFTNSVFAGMASCVEDSVKLVLAIDDVVILAFRGVQLIS